MTLEDGFLAWHRHYIAKLEHWRMNGVEDGILAWHRHYIAKLEHWRMNGGPKICAYVRLAFILLIRSFPFYLSFLFLQSLSDFA